MRAAGAAATASADSMVTEREPLDAATAQQGEVAPPQANVSAQNATGAQERQARRAEARAKREAQNEAPPSAEERFLAGYFDRRQVRPVKRPHTMYPKVRQATAYVEPVSVPDTKKLCMAFRGECCPTALSQTTLLNRCVAAWRAAAAVAEAEADSVVVCGARSRSCCKSSARLARRCARWRIGTGQAGLLQRLQGAPGGACSSCSRL